MTKEVNKWNKFKEGATNPTSMCIAKIWFYIGIGIGSFLASYSFFSSSSWGMGLMFVCVGLLQIVAVIQESKQYKSFMEFEKMVEDNKKEANKIMKEVM